MVPVPPPTNHLSNPAPCDIKLFESGVVPLELLNTLTPTANDGAFAYTVIVLPVCALVQAVAELPPGPTTNGYNAIVVVDVDVLVDVLVEVEVDVVLVLVEVDVLVVLVLVEVDVEVVVVGPAVVVVVVLLGAAVVVP